MNTGRLLARVIHELDIACFPIIIAHEHGLEGDSIADGSEAEDDGADLVVVLVGGFIPQGG